MKKSLVFSVIINNHKIDNAIDIAGTGTDHLSDFGVVWSRSIFVTTAITLNL